MRYRQSAGALYLQLYRSLLAIDISCFITCGSNRHYRIDVAAGDFTPTSLLCCRREGLAREKAEASNSDQTAMEIWWRGRDREAGIATRCHNHMHGSLVGRLIMDRGYIHEIFSVLAKIDYSLTVMIPQLRSWPVADRCQQCASANY